MLIAADIGNSNIVFGVFRKKELFFISKIVTDKAKLPDEYSIILKNILDMNKISADEIKYGIVSSVVPKLTDTISAAINKLLGINSLILGPGLKTGLNIMINNPSELGGDLVACAIGVAKEFEGPVIIIDMGTATTFSVIEENAKYSGTIIYPGMKLSLDALCANAAQLPEISVDIPKHLIGTNSEEAMRAGIIYGNAAMIDGIIDDIAEHFKKDFTVVATGGLASYVLPYCKHKITYKPDLLLTGLYHIFCKNRPKSCQSE